MAHYSNLNDSDFAIILKKYGIKKILSAKILSGGSENTNYLIQTPVKAFVLTICEQKSSENAIELASLLEHLRNNNFITSKIVKTTKGKLITNWNDKPVMLKEFIEGSIIKDLPESILKYLGSELAKLHQIEAPEYLQQKLSYGIEHFNELKDYAAESTFYPWLIKTKEYIEKHLNTDLPKALIHSDIFYDNIIVTNEGTEATIMDFEEACHYFRVFDIGMMIIGTCTDGEKVNFDKVYCLLNGYEQEVKLSPIETNALQAFIIYAAAATAFWRYKQFNYIHIDPAMKDHYLSMKNLADYVFNIPSKEFKNLLER